MTNPYPDFSKRRLSIDPGYPRTPRRRPPKGFSWFVQAIRRLFSWLSQFSIRSLLLIGTGCVLTGIILYLLWLWLTLPTLRAESLLAVQSTTITDRNGIELYRVHGEEDRTIVPGGNIPIYMKQAMIAIEDERFYERDCLDIRALLRAVVMMGRAGGGSTITRQLARNALKLHRDSIVSRKLKELILGCQLEGQYSKEELLELYLNWIPFGQNAYGIEQASKLYFGTTTDQLTLGQSVILASLPQRPTYLSPYGRNVRTIVKEEVENMILDGVITSAEQLESSHIRIGLLGNYIGSGSTTVYVGGRTDQVLENMVQQGYIDDTERDVAIAELQEMTFQPARESIRAPHFVLWVREQVEQMFAGKAEQGILELGGWTIETTLDWQLQQIAQNIIGEKRDGIYETYGARNMSLVAVDPTTREVVAYVGNSDFSDEHFGGKIDMVQVPRQTGSSFKPIAYAAAFNEGLNPASVLWDVPTKIGEDEPQNFDGEFMGPLTIRNALAASRNIPAAKAYFLGGGEEEILSLAAELGAPTPKNHKADINDPEFKFGWPLALGSAETPLIEMVNAYTTFADGGISGPIISIRRITDQQGNVIPIPENQATKRRVIDERIAYQITSILSDQSVRPDDFWRTQLSVSGYQSAAKTGTSNKCLEFGPDGICRLRKPDNAWTIGYTPELVAGVWVGNVDAAAMYEKAGGLNTASPIWNSFMQRARTHLPGTTRQFSEPSGLTGVQVSLLSGQLPTDCTPVELRRADIFLANQAPRQPDPACKTVLVDKLTGLLASDLCPEDAQEEQSFLVPQSIVPSLFPTWETAVQDWVQEQMSIAREGEASTGTLRLPLPAIPVESCDPTLTPGRLNVPVLEIAYPTEGGVAEYPTFKPRILLDVASGSSIRQITYFIDDKRVAQTLSGSLAETLRMPRSIEKSGQHTLRVKVVDQYFNTVEQEVSFGFEVDTRAPILQLKSPNDRERIEQGSTIIISAEASDADGGLRHVQFFLNNELLTTKPSRPFALTYTMDVPAGSHKIKAIATDFAGNTVRREVGVIVYQKGSNPPVIDDDDSPVTIGPYFSAPTEDSLTIALNEIIDIKMTTPSITEEGYLKLLVIVENEQTGESDQLLRLSSGKGTYTRPWQARRRGNYTVRLVTQDRFTREDTVWEEKGVEVE